MRILIVEDQLEVLDCLRDYSTEKGHEVFSACTAYEAIDCLSRAQPELAFIDLLLPKGHGRQVIQEITKRHLPTRMVVVTACDDLDLRKELMGYGVTEYLFKPVTIRDLDALMVPGTKSP
jgi:DNA-binding response OmpR family regulator